MACRLGCDEMLSSVTSSLAAAAGGADGTLEEAIVDELVGRGVRLEFG